MFRLKLILTILFYLASSAIFGQELVSSSGESYKSANYSLDWSLGETITTSLSSEDKILTQGFHQGILSVTSSFELDKDPFDIFVFPNPMQEKLYLKTVLDYNTSFSLFNFKGKKILSRKVKNEIEEINLSLCKSGTYFLAIFNCSQLIQSFQILKID